MLRNNNVRTIRLSITRYRLIVVKLIFTTTNLYAEKDRPDDRSTSPDDIGHLQQDWTLYFAICQKMFMIFCRYTICNTRDNIRKTRPVENFHGWVHWTLKLTRALADTRDVDGRWHVGRRAESFRARIIYEYNVHGGVHSNPPGRAHVIMWTWCVCNSSDLCTRLNAATVVVYIVCLSRRMSSKKKKKKVVGYTKLAAKSYCSTNFCYVFVGNSQFTRETFACACVFASQCVFTTSNNLLQ